MIQPGARVIAQYAGDGEWYGGRYVKPAANGNHLVDWDDGSGVSEATQAHANMPLLFSNCTPGRQIEAEAEGGLHYPAQVEKQLPPAHLIVRWFDGLQTATIPFSHVSLIYAGQEFKPPSRVQISAVGTPQQQLAHITDQWTANNGKFFGSRLRLPHFKLLPNQAIERFRRRGYWMARTRVLALNPRIFNNEAAFFEVLTHEQCHQAVSEIDRAIDPNGGHGPHWIAWMEHCGLDPSRYDSRDQDDYQSEDEKQAKLERMQTRENVLRAAGAMLFNPAQLHSWASTVVNTQGSNWPLPAQIYSPDAGQLRFVAILKRENKPGFWTCLDQQALNGIASGRFPYLKVPETQLYQPSADQLSQYHSNLTQWRAAGLKFLAALKRQADIKRAHRAGRSWTTEGSTLILTIGELEDAACKRA